MSVVSDPQRSMKRIWLFFYDESSAVVGMRNSFYEFHCGALEGGVLAF
jgi:hypothetical protein